jgi:hypothetical protein
LYLFILFIFLNLLVLSPTLRQMSLMDPFNPAGGIRVKYNGGNTCSKASDVDELEDVGTCSAMLGPKGAAEAYCTRSLTLNVKCRNEVSGISNTTEVKFPFICILKKNVIRWSLAYIK